MMDKQKEVVTEVAVQRPDGTIETIYPADEVLHSTLSASEYVRIRADAIGGRALRRTKTVTTTITAWRRVATTLAVVLGVIALSATTAQARPGEPGDRSYLGPLTGAHFAGHRVSACVFVDPQVFVLPTESCIGRW